jgi:acetate kinase
MPNLPILTLNSGSSSIKFTLFEATEAEPSKLIQLIDGSADGIGTGKSKFWIKDAAGNKIVDETPNLPNPETAFQHIAGALLAQESSPNPLPRPQAIGHRMVNGGPTVTENQRLTPELISEMERYTNFAPLHSPIAIYIMRQALQLFPGVPNFVCLDNYFHRTLPEVTRRLPIPEKYAAMGIRRFGAHGLSYGSIVAHLSPAIPSRLIVAHLGNGASVAAIRDGQSIDTAMGLTPTGGIISGSRTGDLDPGVLLFLLRDLLKTAKDGSEAADQLEQAVNHQSGLLGVSQLSSDMRALREAIGQGNANARLAVDQFTYVLRKYIAGYVAVLGGLDMLVFTGGIGENDPATRAEVCAGLECFGIRLDPDRNHKPDRTSGGAILSSDDSSSQVMVIPAEEDLIIAGHVRRLISR